MGLFGVEGGGDPSVPIVDKKGDDVEGVDGTGVDGGRIAMTGGRDWVANMAGFGLPGIFALPMIGLNMEFCDNTACASSMACTAAAMSASFCLLISSGVAKPVIDEDATEEGVLACVEALLERGERGECATCVEGDER
jgi:hypothetical protein